MLLSTRLFGIGALLACAEGYYTSPQLHRVRNHGAPAARADLPVHMSVSRPAPKTRTGTSYLTPDAKARAKEGTKFEKIKLEKDTTNIFQDVYEYAAAIRAGTLDWKDVEDADINTRLKWVGMLHRAKKAPGTFMMRLRCPNGIVTSEQMRFYADSVEPYGPERGVFDITTRQNIQLRGITLEDGVNVMDGLHKLNQTCFQTGFDNVRNMVGSPLAGIDEHELVDTRPFTNMLNDLITVDPNTGERGNPQWCNMPRKFNIAVSGSRDDFSHTYINDIGLDPCVNAETGEMGFNVVFGGYMSIKRVAQAVDGDIWVPANLHDVRTLCMAVLRIFRDEGDRKDRQKARLMWLVEKYGLESWREEVLKEVAKYDTGVKARLQRAQPHDKSPFTRRELLGIHKQPQEGKVRVGIHVPVGRVSPAEARQMADLADKYSGGEIRMTVEQNIMLPNVDEGRVNELLAEPSLNGKSRLSVNPGNIVGHTVSCTGSEFCGLAIIETKTNAHQIAEELNKLVSTPRPLRIHWTGCPNSCGQVQAADIGIMGGPAKKLDPKSGKMKAVPGCSIFVGGTIGEGGQLSLDPYKKAVPLDPDDLLPELVDIVVKEFGGKKKGFRANLPFGINKLFGK